MAKAERHTHKARWISGLRAVGLVPEICALESSSSQSELDEAERFCIAYFRSVGCNLTNACEGGEGRKGPLSESTRERMAIAVGVSFVDA